MKKATTYLLPFFALSVFLAGCLDLEGTRIIVDLEEDKVEIVYLNIVSNSETESEIEADFQGLLKMAYEEKGDTVSSSLVFSELYEEDGQLNGRQLMIVKDREAFLKQYNITKDYRGYIMELDDNESYGDGNGIYVQSSAGRQVFWDKENTVISAEIVADTFNTESTSLLPYWRKWQKWDSMKGADVSGLVTRKSEEVDTVMAEDSLDYCPDDICYSFTTAMRSPGSFNRLSDFVYIYMYNMMEEPSLDSMKASGEDLSVVERNMIDCPDAGPEENAKCAMQNLVSAYSIKLKQIEYEELEKKETVIDLKALLAP